MGGAVYENLDRAGQDRTGQGRVGLFDVTLRCCVSKRLASDCYACFTRPANTLIELNTVSQYNCQTNSLITAIHNKSG